MFEYYAEKVAQSLVQQSRKRVALHPHHGPKPARTGRRGPSLRAAVRALRRATISVLG